MFYFAYQTGSLFCRLVYSGFRVDMYEIVRNTLMPCPRDVDPAPFYTQARALEQQVHALENNQQSLLDKVAYLEQRLEGNRAYNPPNANYSGKRKNSSSDSWNRSQNSQKRPKNSFKTDDHVPYHQNSQNSNGQSTVSYTITSEGQNNS